MTQITKKDKNLLLKSPEQALEILDKVLVRATKGGATDVAVSFSHSQGISVEVRMGQVDTVTFNEDKGVSVTVYIGKQKGSASSTDTSEAALDNMVNAACDIASVSASDPCFGLADKSLMCSNPDSLDLFHPWDIQTDEAIERALQCEKHALGLDKRLVNSDGVGLSTVSHCSAYMNTAGAKGVIYSSRHGMSCSLIAEQDGKMQRDYDYTTARKPKDLVSVNQLGESAAERTLSRLGARKIKTQKAPVLFSNRLSSRLMGYFISAISGSNLYRKRSFLLDSLGKVIFPQFVQVYEQPLLLGGLGSTPMDSDGVNTRDNHFVVDGKVEQYVLGHYSANRLKMKTTGNADGVHNMTVDATTGDVNMIAKSLKKGLLVTETMGQGVNILTGDYSVGAFGYWIEEGEIIHPVEEVTIAGNLGAIFQGIEAIGNDINPNYSTRCGSILVNEMTIAGN
ncbi:metalloprotease PmbA [Legionella sp. W05-934-2]|uniref:metalloprotease PmbA n=1 Tax=Legionella sp. W05-934-2 TaxID=1198649 RepID=UPI003461DB15